MLAIFPPDIGSPVWGAVSYPVPFVPQASNLSLQIGFQASVDPPILPGIRNPDSLIGRFLGAQGVP